MIKMTKAPGPHPGSMKYAPVGDVENESDFAAIGEGGEKEIHVDCGGIRRCNSVGIKGWIQTFKKLTGSGAQVFFYHLPPTLVDQLNILKHLLCGGKLVSILLPYNCTGCSAEQLLVGKLTDIPAIQANPPKSKCGKCGADTEFDDDPSQFFQFMNWIQKP
ncbi:MAG: hypothetical protein JNL01_07805 [Bdellovibrionales bacterium]|nr:hypothetical protein [Bdellovibrionales bacterium]